MVHPLPAAKGQGLRGPSQENVSYTTGLRGKQDKRPIKTTYPYQHLTLVSEMEALVDFFKVVTGTWKVLVVVTGTWKVLGVGFQPPLIQ